MTVRFMKSKFFKLCKKLSACSDHHQHKLGALVCKKNRILGCGWNQLKTDPKSNHPFKSTHAEFMAIRNCNPDELKGATIYVYRENKQGELVNAHPCPSCYELLKLNNIKEVIYTNNGSYDRQKII